MAVGLEPRVVCDGWAAGSFRVSARLERDARRPFPERTIQIFGRKIQPEAGHPTPSGQTTAGPANRTRD
jgi:hypothetical protein